MGKSNSMYGKPIHITRSRQRHEKHISIRIDSDGTDAEELTKKIRKLIREINNLSDEKYSYEILMVKIPHTGSKLFRFDGI